MANVTVYGKYVTEDGFTKDFERTFDSVEKARAFFYDCYYGMPDYAMGKSVKSYAIGKIVRSSNGKVIGKVVFGRYELVSNYNNKAVMTSDFIAYQTNDTYPDYAQVIKFGGKIDSAYYLRKVKNVPIMKRELTL